MICGLSGSAVTDYDELEQQDAWDNTAKGDWFRYGIDPRIPDPRLLRSNEIDRRCRCGWSVKELESMNDEN